MPSLFHAVGETRKIPDALLGFLSPVPPEAFGSGLSAAGDGVLPSTKQQLVDAGRVVGVKIAHNSPVAVYATKKVLNSVRNEVFSQRASLEYVRNLNGGLLQSEDLRSRHFYLTLFLPTTGNV